MVGALLVAAALTSALLVSASLRLPSLTSTLLVAYLMFVANLAVATWALSPLHAVTRGGLAVVEGLCFEAALTAWWLRGRPGLALARARRALRAIVVDPPTALFLAVVASLLAYELVLVLTAPPNNWDSLTYHLARVAAWMHHGGIYEIPNVPSANFNEYPPLAEQQILFLFVATGSGALFAVPQYVAQLAILVAVYGIARRLGFDFRTAACSAFLLATFSLVALEATTAQNDLVAASFPVTAACLLLGERRIEFALAGAAAAVGLGAKPTTALVLPILVWLAITRGRRAFAVALAGGVVGFAAIGMWSYVLNLVHTGNVFGHGGWTTIGVYSQQPLHASAFATGVDVLYELFDVAALSDHLIRDLWIAGLAAAALVLAVRVARRARVRRAVVEAAAVAVPFVAPVLMFTLGNAVAYFARRWGFPVRGSGGNVGPVNRRIGGAAFGPIGAVILLGIPFVTVGVWARRRVDVRHLVLAFALPVFFVLLAQATFNYYLTRFVLIPAALTAPLFARLFASRAATAAYVVVASLAVGLLVAHDPERPLNGTYGHPWQLTQVEAVELTQVPEAGAALAAYDRFVPARACVGAVLGGDEPAYLLSGARLSHPVTYLPAGQAVTQALAHRLSYVVISTGINRPAAGLFRGAGWNVRPLGSYWLLATVPLAGTGNCRT